jgi:hypothetical protein
MNTDNSMPMADRRIRPATVERTVLKRAKSVDLGDEEADTGLV